MPSDKTTKLQETRDLATTEFEISFWLMNGSSRISKHLEVIRIALLGWEKAQDLVRATLHHWNSFTYADIMFI